MKIAKENDTTSFNVQKNIIKTLKFSKNLCHNNFDVNFEHNENSFSIKVAGNPYLNATINGDEILTCLATGDVFKQTISKDHNLLKTFYNDKLISKNVYNSFGKLIQKFDYTNNNEILNKFVYDKNGNVIKQENIQHGLDFSSCFSSNENSSTCKISFDNFHLNYNCTFNQGNQIKITFPNGSKQTISYDSFGRIEEICHDDFVRQIHYGKNDLISRVCYGVGGIITEIIDYLYDDLGNLIEIKENGNLISRFSFDCFSRLIREDNSIFNKTFTFNYDAGGNVVSRTEHPFSLAENLSSGTTYFYSYPTSGWRDQLRLYNNEVFEYDEIGNPTTYRSENFVWTRGNLLKSIGNHSRYEYNSEGERISRTIGDETVKFFLLNNNIIYQDNGLTFYYGVDGVAGFSITNSNGVTEEFIFKKNIFGDIIGIYDSNNDLICKYYYDAWGNFKTYLSHNSTFINLDLCDRTIPKLSHHAKISAINPFRFRGYYYDEDIGLYYFNKRYYDPEVGRFLSPPSLINFENADLSNINFYSFNPNA